MATLFFVALKTVWKLMVLPLSSKKLLWPGRMLRVMKRLLQNLRHLRFRLRPAELVTLVLIILLFSAALGKALAPFPFSPLPQSRAVRANAIYTAWNDMARSMTAENKLLEELEGNLKQNPPESVFDSRRPELYRLAIAEHRAQLRALQAMQSADK